MTGALSAGDVATFTLDSASSDIHLLTVNQNGLNLQIEIRQSGDGTRYFKSPLRRDESEYVLLEALPGEIEIAVAPHEEFTDATGEYVITVDKIRPSAVSPTALSALRLMSRAASELAAESGDPQAALDMYVEAADLWDEVGELRKQAQSLYSAAMISYRRLEDSSVAAELAEAAEVLYRGLDDPRLVANLLSLQAYALADLATGGEQATFDNVFQRYEQSREIHEAEGSSFDLAHVIGWQALAYYYRGDPQFNDIENARAGYDQALRLFSELGEWREALNVRQNRALIHFDEGRSDLAAAEFESILRDIRPGQAEYFRGIVLSNLGYAYWNSGNYDAALQSFSPALEIHRRLKKFDWEADALMGLGKTYLALGELDRAKSFLSESQAAFKNDARVWVSILGNLGDIEYAQGNFEAALGFHQASVDASNSRIDIAYRKSFVARDLLALGQYVDAIASADEILNTPNVWSVLQADAALVAAESYLGLGSLQSASGRFETALSTYEALGSPALQADALNGLAQVASASGDLELAVDIGEESLRRIETIRANVSAPLLRAQYSAKSQGFYKAQISLLMSENEGESANQEFIRDALSISERSRGRLTADLIAEASLRLDDRLPGADRDRRRDLIATLRSLHSQLEAGGRRNVDEFQQSDSQGLLANQLTVQTELDLIETRLRDIDPLGAQLLLPEPLDTAGIQALLKPNATLIQYSLNEPESFAWIV
ncbi:MAG: tetratricopeptide repeat protein, partial [Cyanobacteria bacterium P01_E01_bin.48]